MQLFRLDDKEYYGIKGGKAQVAYHLINGATGIVTCGSRHSEQVLAFAKMCDKLNTPCVVHIPRGQDTKMINELLTTNATVIREKVGYNNVLNAHARDNAIALGYKFIPLGMKCEEAYNIIATNVDDLLKLNPTHLVVPVGSGTTLVGVLKGLQKHNVNIPVTGVMVGLDARKFIDKEMNDCPYDDLEIVKSPYKYNNEVIVEVNGVALNPIYEAKCKDFMRNDSTLYVVAC